MAFAPSDFEQQYKELSRYADDFSGQVVLETNKRVVVRFKTNHQARLFAFAIRHVDYQCDIERGRKTNAMYAQVFLNAPY